MPITCTTANIKELIIDILVAKEVPMIVSSPGCGKTSIITQIAHHFNLEPIIFTLATRDPTDMIGYGTLTEDRQRSNTAPPLYFPIEGDPLPPGKEGWLIFFDDASSAPPLMQAACYQIMLDRLVGFKKLHDRVAMVAAGNLETDNAVTNALSTAMQSRLIHLVMEVDVQQWLDHAVKNNYDYRVIAFIHYKPEALHAFDPNHDDLTFRCPRTWHKLSNIIKPMKTISESKLPLIAGSIGTGAAYDFYSFIEVMHKLPTIEEILANPEVVNIDNDPGTNYALIGLLVHHVTVSNIDILMVVMEKLSMEFQVIGLMQMIKKDINIYETPVVKKWTDKNYHLLIN